MMKSDPIQGILFKTTEPVLLKQKAARRSRHVKITDTAKNDTFFDKLHTIKQDTTRLARRKSVPVVDAVLRYEAYIPARLRSKKTRD